MKVEDQESIRRPVDCRSNALTVALSRHTRGPTRRLPGLNCDDYVCEIGRSNKRERSGDLFTFFRYFICMFS